MPIIYVNICILRNCAKAYLHLVLMLEVCITFGMINFMISLMLTQVFFVLQGAFPARLKHIYILSAPLWFRVSLGILSSFVGEKITSRVGTSLDVFNLK